MSHGYVQYRIKTISGLANGVQIPNTAHIFFDFNPPVTTNTTINNINFNTAIINQKIRNNNWVWPMPFHDYLIIETEAAGEYVVKNILGETLNFGAIGEFELLIPTIQWPAGVYIIEITCKNSRGIKKIIKQ
jgi:hypothetical protein